MQSLRRTCFGVISLLMMAASGNATSASKDEIVYALDDWVKQAVATSIPGASLAVVVNGQIRLLRGYGVAKVGSKQRVTSSTRFPLASISKTFASAATSLLVDKQLIDWDTHVVPYLEHIEFSDPQQGSAVTLRHLLSHTSGLVPQAYSDLLEDNVSYTRIVQMIKRINFVCEPGDCYGYQNIIYNLSAEMVEHAAGQDYPTFVKEQIFIPLEMEHATFGIEGFTSNEDRVAPHVKTKSGCAAVKPQEAYYQVPAAAGINASAQDLAKWMLAQFGHQPAILNPDLLSIMHKPHIRANQMRYKAKLSNVYYGLGWRTFDYQGLSGFIHHGGWVKGIRTEMLFNTVTQTGVVFLINCERNNVARGMVLEFLKLYKKYMVDKVQSSVPES